MKKSKPPEETVEVDKTAFRVFVKNSIITGKPVGVVLAIGDTEASYPSSLAKEIAMNILTCATFIDIIQQGRLVQEAQDRGLKI